MHEIYQMLATDLQRERVRKADNWRLAQQARRAGGPTLAGRAWRFLAALVGQRPPTPARSAAESPACGS